MLYVSLRHLKERSTTDAVSGGVGVRLLQNNAKFFSVLPFFVICGQFGQNAHCVISLLKYMIAFRTKDYKAVAIVQVCVNRFCIVQKRIPALTEIINQLLSLSVHMRGHPLSVDFLKSNVFLMQ